MDSAADPPGLTDDRLSVSVLTGFLGSGKTTLLNRLLRHRSMGETAVIVNEFGEIGIDNALIVGSSDQVLLLESGCMCCALRGDLIETLGELMAKRKRGDVPEFKRVVIETTGIADPAPILQALMADEMMLNCFRMGPVLTVVDAYHGARTLEDYVEAVKQAALADRIALSKTDVAPADAIAELRNRLRKLNPTAPVIETATGVVDPDQLLGSAAFDLAEKTAQVRAWFSSDATGRDRDAAPHDEREPHAAQHHDRIHSYCLTFDSPLDWEDVAGWLDALAERRGADLLRVKGLLNVKGQDEPVVIQGVHHLFHPPSALPAWPDADRRSRLVFIVRDLDRAAIEAGAPG